ncbi:hypothetical protein EDB85DRAFT_2276638 [Lactarius pseudohatsudake]|nr:hypothetical protein EDB85DRAFT_2276638 [Lactarius pseudohatsudake]
MPASTMPSISSDFEYMPSETVDQPASTLSSTPPPSSSILPTFVRSAMNSQPEPEPTLASECLIPPSTGDVPEITSTPPSSSVSLTNLDCVPSAVVDNPEFEPEHASLSSITPTSPPLPAPSLPLEFTDDIREFLSPLPTPLSTSLACSEYSTSLSSPTNPSPSETPTSMPSDPHSIPAHSSWPLRSSSGDSSDTVVELVVVPVSLNPSKLSLSLGETIPPPDCSLASHPSPLSIEVSPLLEISTPDPLRPFELDSTPSPAVDIVPLSQPEPSWSSPCESVLLAPLEPIQCPPTLPQRPPGLQTVGSDSSALEVAPALALSTPQLEWQEPSPVCEAPSTLVPCLPHPTTSLLPSSLTHCDFAFALVTTAILVSTLLDILATLSTHSRKFWSKYEDFGNSQIGTLNTSSRDVFAQQLRLGQLTPRAPRLVFDPGGVFKFKRSSSRLPSAHEDVRKRMPKTRNGFITHVAIPVPVPIDNLVFDPGGQSSSSSVQVSRLLSAHEDVRKRKSKTFNNLTVFDPGGGALVLEPAHEDSATLDEDARSSLTGDGQDFDPPGGVRPAFGLSPKPFVSIASATRPFSVTSTAIYPHPRETHKQRMGARACEYESWWWQGEDLFWRGREHGLGHDHGTLKLHKERPSSHLCLCVMTPLGMVGGGGCRLGGSVKRYGFSGQLPSWNILPLWWCGGEKACHRGRHGVGGQLRSVMCWRKCHRGQYIVVLQSRNTMRGVASGLEFGTLSDERGDSVAWVADRYPKTGVKGNRVAVRGRVGNWAW